MKLFNATFHKCEDCGGQTFVKDRSLYRCAACRSLRIDTDGEHIIALAERERA